MTRPRILYDNRRFSLFIARRRYFTWEQRGNLLIVQLGRLCVNYTVRSR